VCLGAADLATAWLAHTVGDLDAAHAKYEAATMMNARIGARSWLAQTHADHARLLVDRNRAADRTAACELIETATRDALDIGLPSITRTLGELRLRLDMKPDVAVARAPEPSAIATFRRSGPVWDVAFGTRSVRVRHVRGMSDIAYLLARPGEAVSVVELAGDEGSPVSLDRGAQVFDERARREVRNRLRELDIEIAEADAAGDRERGSAAREELQVLAETVSRDIGLGGRPRRLGDPVERARKTVSTRIRRAIEVVAAEHPELGRHLIRSIDTGAWCAYRPPEHVAWNA
jgi:hypothetical protein